MRPYLRSLISFFTLFCAVLFNSAFASNVDLTSMRGITIGGGIGGFGPTAKFVPWGGTVILRQADAIAIGNGRCAFDVTYDVANLGSAPTTIPFSTWLVATRIVAATINGVPQNNGQPDFPENLNAYIAARPYNLQINALQSKNISTQPYLPSGTFTLQLRIDPDNKVEESNEVNNNALAIKVELPDLCGGVAATKTGTTTTETKPNTDTKSNTEVKPNTTALAKPDITSIKGVTVGGAIGGAGGKFVAWGGNLSLTDADAFLISNGNCAFNLAYDMSNLSSAPTTAQFKNSLFANGKIVALQSALSMAGGQNKIMMTQPYLPSGSYELTVYLDSDNVVAESIESNNRRSIKVTSNASCGRLPEAKADLASVRGIAFGDKTVVWGGTIKLNRANAFAVSNGKCAFNISYDTTNLGKVNASGFSNRLYAGTTLIGEQSNLSVDANASKLIHTQAYLNPGLNAVMLKLDANDVISEGSEFNNIQQVSVNVDTSCK